MAKRRPRFLMAVLLLCAFLLPAASDALAQEGPGSGTAERGAASVRGCSELLVNGGFEVTDLGWQTFGAEAPPAYTTSPVFSGTQAMRLGLVEGTNIALINGIRQTVMLPSSATSAVLAFHYRPTHEANPGDDLQYVDVYNGDTDVRITRLWSQLANEGRYILHQFDLTGLRGQRLRLEFGVRNDGGGGRTALFLDDVSLLACDVAPGQTPTPTPTNFSLLPTATPTWITGTPTVYPSLTPSVTPSVTPTREPTPLPSGCISETLLRNGGFEEPIGYVNGWLPGDDPVPPIPVSDAAFGLRAMQLGNPPGAGSRNVVTYSSVRQLIYLPAGAATAQISWWHQSRSQEGPDDQPNRWRDRQELILLEPNLTTKRILYRLRENVVEWQTDSVDLTPYIGDSFYVYFNAFNDGNGLRTWMLLDEVRLEVCYPGFEEAVPLPATANPLPATVVIPTIALSPTATPPAYMTATATATVLAAAPDNLPGSDEMNVAGMATPPAPAAEVTAVGIPTEEVSQMVSPPRSAEPVLPPAELTAWQRFIQGIDVLPLWITVPGILLLIYLLWQIGRSLFSMGSRP